MGSVRDELSLSLDAGTLQQLLPPITPMEEPPLEDASSPALDSEGKFHGSGRVAEAGCVWEGRWDHGEKQGVHQMFWPDGKSTLQLYIGGRLAGERQGDISSEALVTFELRKRLAVRDAAIRQLQLEKTEMQSSFEQQKKTLTQEFARKTEQLVGEIAVARAETAAARSSLQEEIQVKQQEVIDVRSGLEAILQTTRSELEESKQKLNEMTNEIQDLKTRWDLRPSKRMRTTTYKTSTSTSNHRVSAGELSDEGESQDSSSSSLESPSPVQQPDYTGKVRKSEAHELPVQDEAPVERPCVGYICPDCKQRTVESYEMVLHCRETGHSQPQALQQLLHGVHPSTPTFPKQKKKIGFQIKFASDIGEKKSGRKALKKSSSGNDTNGVKGSSSPVNKLKIFKCPVRDCGSSYEQRSSLRRHKESRHPDTLT
eukprot:gb/GEZN01002449.1/.p1 GENE.gb/GEZN01002449.1/~~gb/GEZN01002449.1/.p1  ORF type:complete len:428 (-),score=66.24 gb/GEZN01002449.1/:26-1309(-)